MGLLGACQQPRVASLEGHLEGLQTDSIYLYRVLNEHYSQMELLRSIPVKEGHFSCLLDSMPVGLYSLSLQDMMRGGGLQQFANLFLEPKPMQVTVKLDRYQQLELKTAGSALQDQYAAFQQAKREAGHREVLDSLDRLFYEARDKGEREEMERIREVSMPYYQDGAEKTGQLIQQQLEQSKGTLFGLYLYYAYRFQNHTFNTNEEIAEARAFLDGLDAAAQQSVFYTNVEEGLNRFAKCATGSLASDIVGKNLQGKTMRLSDFKGQYVLVDFWFAGCTWCRKETPYLKRAYESFRKKGFTILGVSTDRKETEWRQAIQEDQTHWNHILLDKEDVRRVLETYCIVGFPHILLVNPEGRIVAKELRGEELVKTVEHFVTQP